MLLELKQVSKIYGNWLSGTRITGLNEISFKLKRGDIICITGRNGSGKSTLLRIASDLTRPSLGEVKWNFQNNHNTKLASRVGYCPDNPQLYHNVSTYRFLTLIAKLARVGESKKVINNWLDDLNLTKSIINEPIRKLSKGMTLKVALIATLIDRPQIIILDEPFSSLDSESQQKLTDKLKDLARLGSGILIADPSEFFNLVCHKRIKLC